MMNLISCFSDPLKLLEQVVTACGGGKKKLDYSGKKTIKGTVVLMKKDVLGYNDFSGDALTSLVRDEVDHFLGQNVSLQLISADHTDPENGLRGKLGSVAYLENVITTKTQAVVGESAFTISFDWDEEELGIPGAFIIKNFHYEEFYLKNVILEDASSSGQGHRIVFLCNSWVYPANVYAHDRVFFSNKTYLPSETPKPLLPYREDELKKLRGNGTGELQEWDRVYDYAYYNDLGDPDKSIAHARPVLGGSPEYPYPRRGRTGRPPTKTDAKCESRLALIEGINIYVPRDERFGHLKMSDFIAFSLKSAAQVLLPESQSLLTHGNFEKDFDSLEAMLKLYADANQPPTNDGFLNSIAASINSQMLKDLVQSDGEEFGQFPRPLIIREDVSSWRTDEGFTREMLAGVNPVIICRLKEFPPRSKLNPDIYGKQDSTITREQVENTLDGLTIDEAIEANRLFILDYHDTLMPYLRRINSTSTKMYASRTILFLQADGTLKPLAIELSLPNPDGDQHGAISEVYLPSKHGVEGSVWHLAKTYVTVNDSGVHQLISHWYTSRTYSKFLEPFTRFMASVKRDVCCRLHTHAVIEPFIIATNRQLSVIHPIYKLLYPHFRDTMNINALARHILISEGGFVESTVFPGKYAMEISAVIYKDWVFPEQALPTDLIKRGMAVEDQNARHGLRLLIEDYPFAVDGLEIWFAIKAWVNDYCNLYYRSDETIQGDEELQSWWKELREQGHGDKKDEPWWPKMQTRQELADSCTIIIWIASALHAAVNFGQYPYGGYIPNRPTTSRRFMPKPGTPAFEELKTNPDQVLLKTIPSKLQTLLVIALIENLSRHASDEVYLGQRDTPEWTDDANALEVFERFGKKLAEVEGKIVEMNQNPELKNRNGLAKMPYTLLFPTGEVGLSGKGIPNSVSI